ncbi:uncharacterized protein LOC114941679 [Nylanderia fulva]|uniref:uncharacterized protein LOC114941679 n=1 Tax=Nylanderia fulva TaxID=613905 RepID=UPI0010FB9A2D|nr:uncharacterized protein LOC114941679 [Nylanderia fulva]
MRSYLLIFIVLATVLFYTKHINAEEVCAQENCVTPEKCEEPIKNQKKTCNELGTTCCSIVKEEYRTHCRHHGGVCMETCTLTLQRQAIDCPSQVCCVLV